MPQDNLRSELERLVGELELSGDARTRLQTWLAEGELEPSLEAQIREAGSSPEAREHLQDAFSRDLPIGTGGRRGEVGPGTNRLNPRVLRRTAMGIAAALRAESAPGRVVVVYDTRRDSREFAWLVCAQLVQVGLEARLLDAPRSTPQLSYMVRAHEAGAGVVISASHNPPGDNGIKIYGPDGAQVLGARDARLMEAIVAAGSAELRPLPFELGVAGPPDPGSLPEGFHRLDPEFEDARYLAYVEALGVSGGASIPEDFSLVYTPLHGVGHHSVLPLLAGRGIQTHLVESQLPDGGAFGTVRSANPEDPRSMDAACALADERGAALVVANDPDADRMGAMARDASGAWAFVDGNRLGALLLHHLVSHQASPPPDAWVLTTLVTTPLIAALSASAGVECVDDLLVGFKHHAGMMGEQESRSLLFACEESHGYTRGDEVRDKDGNIAVLLLAELAAELHADGQTLWDRLDRIWAEHGYHREMTSSLYAQGERGRRAIEALMQSWRESPPRMLAGLELQDCEDRAQPRDTGSAVRDLPSNVLLFRFASGDARCRVVVRPSGTEPKVKLYVLAQGPAEGREAVDRCVEEVSASLAQAAQGHLGAD